MDESSTDYLSIVDYINRHPLGVISTINDDGSPEAAVVYVFSISHHTLCFVTRNLTRKYQNIFERPAVSVTIFDDHDSSCLQAGGTAFITNNEHMLTYTMNKIEKLYDIRGDSVSPIEKMERLGDYVLIGVELRSARLTSYKGIDVNMSTAYREISIGD